MNELYEALFQYYKQDNTATIEMLQDLADTIKRNPKVIFKLIDDIITENDLCPECYTQLEAFVCSFENSDFMGRPVQEEIYAKRCPNCRVIVNG